MKIRPYISVDVESTGIDVNNDKILQLAMVFDDGVSSLDSLHTVSFLVNPESEEFHGRIQPVALSMNAWIFDSIAGKTKSKYPVYEPAEARKIFNAEIRDFFYKVLNKDARTKEDKTKKIMFAGKNLQGFDLLLMKSNGYFTSENQKYRGTRALDVGPLYFPEFGYVPCLGEINKITQGTNEVSHDALDDAFDVVMAVRHKAGMFT
ncbi:MAG: hypothetical protein V3U54_07790 [Thermodesulfobacteriota bacterium]